MESKKTEANELRRMDNHSLDSVDLAKFLGSVLIFAMHCSALSSYNNAGFVLELLARWGVPFFFVSSAYFLFRKGAGGNLTRKHVLRYVSRIGMLYLCWMIFNLPSIFYIRLWKRDLTSVNTWLVFLKNSVLSSTFHGSWFLASCIFSACFVSLLGKRFSSKTIILLTFPFYLLCVFTSVYRGVMPRKATEILGFLAFPLNIFNGCFYFALGKYISENERQITRIITKKKARMLSVAFYFVFLLEICISKHFKIFGTTDAAFMNAGLACALFLFCVQTKIHIKNGMLLRKLSIIIYCCQGNVLLFNTLCKKILGVHSLIAFMMSCGVVAVISGIILYAQKKSQWKWVHYLT